MNGFLADRAGHHGVALLVHRVADRPDDILERGLAGFRLIFLVFPFARLQKAGVKKFNGAVFAGRFLPVVNLL
jgi:hypothetical protein